MVFPKVSIIIPIYNPSLSLLSNCLNSATNQSLEEIEIICVNDGSDESYLSFLDDFSKKDSRINIIHQDNFGAGIARNTGINHANGEYVVFLDSDDYIEEDMCEKLYVHAVNLNSDLVLFNAVRHLENNNTMDLIHFLGNFEQNFNSFVFQYDFIKDKVFNAYFGVIWSKFYKLDFIKKFDIQFPHHKLYNDVEFHIKTVLFANRISYYPKIFYHYNRIGQASLQTSFVNTKYAMVFYDVMCDIKDFIFENNFYDEFEEEFLIFSFKEFKRKLDEIDVEYKNEYFLKIKLFFKSLDINVFKLNKISFSYLIFYIHIINSKNFNEFKLMQKNYLGLININCFEYVNDNNKAYTLILENYLGNLVKYADEMSEVLNYYRQKELSNKKNIKNLYPNSEELMRLKDKEKYLIMENNRLNQDNEQLKTSLDLFEKNTIFRILKRIFF